MNIPELLAPAGDINTARIALRFGADAVYLGGPMLQLRSGSVGLTIGDIETIAREAHGIGRRVYVTVNAFARDGELDTIRTYAGQLRDTGIDAAIISDPGVMSAFHERAPEVPIHVSTQANCTNAATARVYYALGAKRVVPARELTLADLKLMRDNLPCDMEIEAFVHGAMCMAYSGRCMISAFLTGRGANRGDCTQPCRWKYSLMEKTRPGEYFPVEETENGMALLSSYDLCALPFLDKLADAGVSSLKIEGRMKSEYYVATVVGAYRRCLDALAEGRMPDILPLMRELDSVSHRPYSSGFYFNKIVNTPGDGGQYEQGCMYAAYVKSVEGSRARVTLKNKFAQGDSLEIVSPCSMGLSFVARDIRGDDGAALNDASVPNRIYTMECPDFLRAGDLLRRRL